MANYGLSESGFIRKRFPEMLSEIRNDLTKGLGADVGFSADTVLGVLTNIEAERATAFWEVMEQVYTAMYPMSATGTNLDKAVSFIGVQRFQNQPSSASVVWYGKEGTTVPDYTCIKNTVTQVKYYTVGDLTITANNAYHVEITPIGTKINAGETLSVLVNGKTYSYTTDRSSIKYAIENLGKQLSASDIIEVSVQDLTLTIKTSSITGVSISVSDKLEISKLGTLGRVETEGASTDLPKEGQLCEMVDLLNGVNAVNNLTAGTAGRFEETDAELYSRYHLGTYHTGAGTIESIRANLLTVEGVNSVAIYENRDDTVNQYGIPPHSFYCVVKGGLDTDIAKTILRYAPAGIAMHGEKAIVTKDSQQNAHTVKFGRPKKVYIWVDVIIETFTDQNEHANAGYIADVVENIIAYGNRLVVGDDVILQRIIGQCVAVSGVSNVQVTLGRTDLLTDAEPTKQASNITIAPNEEAVFNRTIIRVS